MYPSSFSSHKMMRREFADIKYRVNLYNIRLYRVHIFIGQNSTRTTIISKFSNTTFLHESKRYDIKHGDIPNIYFIHHYIYCYYNRWVKRQINSSTKTTGTRRLNLRTTVTWINIIYVYISA